MSDEKVEKLNLSECNIIGKVLFELIKQCPHIPQGLSLKYQDTGKGESISVFTLPGAKYLRWDITGGFTAQVNFQVAYKSYPTTDGQRMESQGIVDNIMGWLEEIEQLPALSDDRKITKITASNSIPCVEKAGNDKSIVFVADAVMEYRKKGT